MQGWYIYTIYKCKYTIYTSDITMSNLCSMTVHGQNKFLPDKSTDLTSYHEDLTSCHEDLSSCQNDFTSCHKGLTSWWENLTSWHGYLPSGGKSYVN